MSPDQLSTPRLPRMTPQQEIEQIIDRFGERLPARLVSLNANLAHNDAAVLRGSSLRDGGPVTPTMSTERVLPSGKAVSAFYARRGRWGTRLGVLAIVLLLALSVALLRVG